MTYDDSATQTLGTAIILALSQSLPTFIGHPVAAAISFVAGNRVFSPTFRAISQNQWVAHDGKTMVLTSYANPFVESIKIRAELYTTFIIILIVLKKSASLSNYLLALKK